MPTKPVTVRAIRFGPKQREIVEAIREGARLFEEVGSKQTKQGRRAYRRLYTVLNDREVEHPRGAVDKLLKRNLVVPSAPRPRQNCFDPEVRRVELVLKR